jgi:hypothetical protein
MTGPQTFQRCENLIPLSGFVLSSAPHIGPQASNPSQFEFENMFHFKRCAVICQYEI